MKSFGDDGTTAQDALREHCPRCGRFMRQRVVSGNNIGTEVHRLEDEHGTMFGRFVLRHRKCNDKTCGSYDTVDMCTIEMKEKDFQRILSLIPKGHLGTAQK